MEEWTASLAYGLPAGARPLSPPDAWILDTSPRLRKAGPSHPVVFGYVPSCALCFITVTHIYI
jgi:hypothetical protein